jgi:CBS domain-containing protein
MELQSILTATTVADLTLDQRAALGPDDTIATAAEEMRTASHGSVLVCEDGRLVGIFTERDILRRMAAGRAADSRLDEAMTRDPKTVACESTLLDAVRMMAEGGYRRLPVVDDQHRPLGVVDVKTLVHFLVEHFPEAVYNQTSSRNSIARSPEGA